jgi:hypothetical protein
MTALFKDAQKFSYSYHLVHKQVLRHIDLVKRRIVGIKEKEAEVNNTSLRLRKSLGTAI